MKLFVNDTVSIEVIWDKKNPSNKNTFKVIDYFDWIKYPRIDKKIRITLAEEIIVSEFIWDENIKKYRGEANIVQFYEKLTKTKTLDGEVYVVTYTDITYKRVEVFLTKEQIPNDQGCVILLGNVYADGID